MFYFTELNKDDNSHSSDVCVRCPFSMQIQHKLQGSSYVGIFQSISQKKYVIHTHYSYGHLKLQMSIHNVCFGVQIRTSASAQRGTNTLTAPFLN